MNTCCKFIPVLFLLFCFGCCCPQNINLSCNQKQASASGEVMKHPQFTRASLSRIRDGMTVDEFEGIFGYPDRSHERKMGTTKFLIYEYDMGMDPHYSHQFDICNTFYFGVDQEPPVLRKWEIDYVHPGGYAEAPRPPAPRPEKVRTYGGIVERN